MSTQMDTHSEELKYRLTNDLLFKMMFHKNEAMLQEVVAQLLSIPNESIQDFVRYVLRMMFKNNLIPSDEISSLLNKEYSKKVFHVYFPLIQENKTKRYWSELFGNRYYVCSQWDKSKTELYAQKIASWLRKMKDLNT